MQKIATGGRAGYIGYEYQILTTVWVALELMLVEALAAKVEIEPASDEDVAAKLQSADPSSTLSVPVAGINLQIQIKHRSSPWPKGEFRDVLNGKKASAPKKKKKAGKAGATKPRPKQTPRLKALEVLAADPTAQWVLITDNGVNPTLRPFEVASMAERSGAATLPWAGGETTSADVPPRIAIFPLRTREVLEFAIDRALGETGSVPSQQREECRKALMQSVRLRLMNQPPSEWTIEEVKETIEKHGGFTDPGRTAVLPENFEAIEAELNRSHAVLISGPTGAGKTVIARELVRLRQLGPDAAAYTHSSQGLGAVNEAMESDGRHVFFIEDPWGGYEVDVNAALWSKALPGLVAQAQPKKQFIITTRTSVRHTATGKLPLELARIEHELRPDHYSREAKLQIFKQAFNGAKPWQKDYA